MRTVGDIGDLSSSPESAIKIDEIDHNPCVAVGEIILTLQQRSLCRDEAAWRV
jgi:hypothetical protein